MMMLNEYASKETAPSSEEEVDRFAFDQRLAAIRRERTGTPTAPTVQARSRLIMPERGCTALKSRL